MIAARDLLAAGAALLVMGCGTPGESPTVPPPRPGESLLLASGTLFLSAALENGDPGQHEVFVIDHQVPDDLPATGGAELVLALRDTRGGQTCPEDEPESGCATVDWSAEPGAPRVPADGRFVNRVDVELASGRRSYFLSRTLRLADVVDLIDPERRHTAVGGDRVEWRTVLPTDLVAGSGLRLRLVMTKWQLPDVRIVYEIRALTG